MSKYNIEMTLAFIFETDGDIEDACREARNWVRDLMHNHSVNIARVLAIPVQTSLPIQAWVTKVTSSDAPDVPLIGALPRMKCGNCESANVTEATDLDSFQYGTGPKAVQIRVAVPIMTCRSCGDRWTDYRAEEIREAAVAEHRAKTPEPPP